MQVGQERGAAGLEEAVGLVGRQFCRLLGIGQCIAALQQCRVLGKTGLGLANGIEYHPVEMRQGRLGHRFGFADARPGAVGRHVPGQRRTEAPAIGRRVAEIVQDTDGTDGRADADVRVQLARGDADTGRRGRQSPLGLPYIGTTLEQRGAIAHRYQLRDFWQLVAGGGAGRQLVHRLGQQHRQAIQPGLTSGFIARHVGAQGFELGLRAGDLGFVATPGIAQALDQRGALGLQVE
ncbi:hypothetical protein D3C71_1252130 [compost metagenome]